VDIGAILVYAIPAVLVIGGGLAIRSIIRDSRSGREMAKSAGRRDEALFQGDANRGRESVQTAERRNEALFQSMFPDLQPHFHPVALHEFVKAWRARKPVLPPYAWNNPPGFAGAAKADFVSDPKGQRVSLVDAAGAPLTQFVLESHAEGAAVRVGPGKFTVNIQDAKNPSVRYWHPKREFKWSRRKGWRFVTPVADESIDSDDRGTSFSRDNSRDNYRDSSSYSSTAAAAAGVAGLGGTFDGGGASAGWEDGGARSDSGSSTTSGSDAILASDSGGSESSGSDSPSY